MAKLLMVNYPNFQEDAAFVALLKALAQQKDLYKGSRLHVSILKCGSLTKNVFIGSALVNMYAKCGALAKAQQVFEELSTPNIVTWNALMAGYIQHGHSEKAIKCFDQIQAEGIPPDGVTFLCILKACGSIGAAAKGKEIHDQIAKEGWLRENSMLGSALVDMYAKCGALGKAQEVFDHLPIRNVVSWTGLITGYAQQGHGQRALDCFERMQGEGLTPNAVTFACILKACGDIGAAAKGNEIHDEIVRKGLLGKDRVLATALVDMYAKCGAFARAQQVFNDLPVRDVVSWNALISGYCQHGHGEEALYKFEEMQHEGLSPDVVTFTCILKACGSIGATEKGQDIHDDIVRKGLLGKHNVLCMALVDMYAKCGALAKAQQVFDELPVRDAVSWNTLITGYCQLGYFEEALNCFEHMKQEGLSPDIVTFACVLKACGSIGASKKGEEVHSDIVREGLLGEVSVLRSALVDMYVKFGALAKAQEVLDKLPVRDVVAWTALIAGYCQHGHGEQALNCFDQMKREGLFPDAVTFACILKACGSTGAAEKGIEIHAEIAREGSLEKVSVLGNALVDMYAKCGALGKAQEVFDNLSVQDEVSWTALIAGCCQHGHGEEALYCFERMKREGLSPDAVTFACILKACGSIGAAEKGQMYYETMSTRYGIIPTLEHHTCMVDLFGRAGHLDKAMAVIKGMPLPYHFPGWSTLVSACQKRGNVKLGSWAFEHAVQLDVKAHCYATAGMQEEPLQIDDSSMGEASMSVEE